MPEEIHQNNQTQNVPPPPSPLSPPSPISSSKPRFTATSWIVLIYIIALISSFIINDATTEGILFFVIVGLGSFTAGAFFNKLVKDSKGKSPWIKFISYIAGFGVGVIIFLISIVAGLTGVLKNIHGD